MYYGQILRWALTHSDSPPIKQQPLKPHMPATTSPTSKTSGDTILGEFVMMRNKDGQRIFVTQDGQIIKK